MKPKHIIIILAVTLFTACNKERLANPDKPAQAVQSTQKFASIIGKWLLTGSAAITTHYTNNGRDSTVKTDSLYNYDYSFKEYGTFTINTYTDKSYTTQDYDPHGNPTYSTTFTYTISGNNLIVYDKDNNRYTDRIITLDEKNLQVSETATTAEGDKRVLNVSFRRQ